jgi:hypothetical protein
MLPFSAICQSGVNSAGGQANSPNGNVSYSIGQWAYQSSASSAGSVEPGVQHAYDITLVSTDPVFRNMAVSLFPNPAHQDITLVIDDIQSERLFYQLFDVKGKLIRTDRIVSESTCINMSGLAGAGYYLHILTPGNKKVKSFSIIKNL